MDSRVTCVVSSKCLIHNLYMLLRVNKPGDVVVRSTALSLTEHNIIHTANGNAITQQFAQI